jgi:DNA-binding NtrC family response regulator
MLVLGDCEKIVDELFYDSVNAQSGNQSDISASEGASLHSIIGFNHDILNDNSFSLKSVKKKATDRVEKEVITHVLKKTDWNRSKASRILKVSYKTLLNKISELEIIPPEGKGDD